MNYVALKKALLEVGRLVVFAIIPILIVQLSNWAFDWRVIFVAGAIAALKFIDKLLHEVGKDSGNESLKKGLSRF